MNKKAPKNELIIFKSKDNKVSIEVNIDSDTVWLTQKQMEALFDVTQSTIAEHISNIFKDGELDEKTSIGNTDKSSGGRIPKIYYFNWIIYNLMV